MTKKNLYSTLLSIFCLVVVTFIFTSVANAQVMANNVPTWAVGSFYGRNLNGDTITLTINNNGRVVDHVNGITSSGTVSGNTLNFDGATSRRIVQSNSGFTTIQNNGMRIDFSRSGGY
jgi:hypothetical protein